MSDIETQIVKIVEIGSSNDMPSKEIRELDLREQGTNEVGRDNVEIESFILDDKERLNGASSIKSYNRTI